MKSFEYTIVVTGCHNCLHQTKDYWCGVSAFDTPEEYEQQNRENYFTLTTCPLALKDEN